MMKNSMIRLLAALLLLAGTTASHQPSLRLTGRLVDPQGNPLEFATAILLGPDSTERAGTVADDKGRFALSAPAGGYTLRIQYLGYDPHSRHVELKKDTDLGDISLTPSAVEVEGVEVKARIITREADRFVVNVAANPASIGKDAAEVLAVSPGMRVSEDKLTLNGQQSPKVMVDDRLLRMSDEDLIVYLRNLNAEDIQKIEIIPSSGADYDADSSSGIIKITLKKRRDDGLTGSISLRTNLNRFSKPSLRPSASFNYHKGRFNLTSRLSYSYAKRTNEASEYSRYYTEGNTQESQTRMTEWNNGIYGNIGAFYDIGKRQSAGVEIGYSHSYGHDVQPGTSMLRNPSHTTRNSSLYGGHEGSDYLSATFNYTVKLDTLGSAFKFIGDITSRRSDGGKRYFNHADTDGTGRDSTYVNLSDDSYNVYSAGADLELFFSSRTRMKTGLKYTYNHNTNRSFYDAMDNATGLFVRDNPNSIDNDYTEQIAALYATFSTKLGKVGIVAGLRGEYTYAAPEARQTDEEGSVRNTFAKQEYFSLFPNANISVPLNGKESTSLVAAYSRRISRPGFWALSPARFVISEYAYGMGDPNLKPCYSDSYSLTAVIAYKYSLTLSAIRQKNGAQQTALTDPENPDVLLYKWSNLKDLWIWTANVNLPFTLTKWWNANINVNPQVFRQQVADDSPRQRCFSIYVSANTTFTLPADFLLELDYSYWSGAIISNLKIGDNHDMNIDLKKRLLKNKLTISAGVHNLLQNKHVVTVSQREFERRTMQDGAWTRPMFTGSVRYNFSRGVKFKTRSIESSGDASRIEGGDR